MGELSIERVAVDLDIKSCSSQKVIRKLFPSPKDSPAIHLFKDEAKLYKMSWRIEFEVSHGRKLHLLVKAVPREEAPPTTPFLYFEWDPLLLVDLDPVTVTNMFDTIFPGAYEAILKRGRVRYLRVRFNTIYRRSLPYLVLNTTPRLLTKDDNVKVHLKFDANGEDKKVVLDASRYKENFIGGKVVFESDPGNGTHISTVFGMKLNDAISELSALDNPFSDIEFKDFTPSTIDGDNRLKLALDFIRDLGEEGGMKRLPSKFLEVSGDLLKKGVKIHLYMARRWDSLWKETIRKNLLLDMVC